MSGIPPGYKLVGYDAYNRPIYQKGKVVVRLTQIVKEGGSIPPLTKPRKRIRQPKSLFDSKLEREWYDHLRHVESYTEDHIRPKGIRLRLPGDVFYTPDFVNTNVGGKPILYEVKGPRKAKGNSKSTQTFKIAAGHWKNCFTFVFVFKEDGAWKKQIMQ